MIPFFTFSTNGKLLLSSQKETCSRRRLAPKNLTYLSVMHLY